MASIRKPQRKLDVDFAGTLSLDREDAPEAASIGEVRGIARGACHVRARHAKGRRAVGSAAHDNLERLDLLPAVEAGAGEEGGGADPGRQPGRQRPLDADLEPARPRDTVI